jgi:hypothetical protein
MKSVGDDLSWSVRKHAFKTGFEWRRQESNGFNDPNYDPVATITSSLVPGNNPVQALDANSGFTGLTNNAGTTARNLLSDLSGSVARINQAFGIVSAQDTKLVGTPTIRNNRHWNYQSELSAYFKDDWKFRDNLTLNLGIHWEWYGQPYEHNGLAGRVIGDRNTFLNVKCTSGIGIPNFTSTCTDLVQVQLVGKNSTHPEIGTYLNGNDNNNFAPSVGFAWNVPYFGKGKTVIRAGYGISYEGALRNFITVDGVIGTVPGINLVSGGSGLDYNPASYLNLASVTLPIPKPAGTPETAPFLIQPTDRSLTISAYERVSPYTQNWNMEIQRELVRNTTLEVRYIGTKGTKLTANEPLNAINALTRNRDLFDAFNAVRGGGESNLLDTMLNGINFGGNGVVGQHGERCSYHGPSAVSLKHNDTYCFSQRQRGYFPEHAEHTNTGVTLSRNRRQTVCFGGGTVSPRKLHRSESQYSGVTLSANLENSTYNALQLQLTRA